MARIRFARVFHRPLLDRLETRDVPSFVTAASYSAGIEPRSVAAGDFNGDAVQDLAVASYGGSGGITVLHAVGDGPFQHSNNYPTGANTRSVTAADVSGDGLLDLVAVNYGTPAGTVSVLIGRADGSFKPAVSYAAATRPSDVAVADFNGDGKPDLAVCNDVNPGTVLIYLGTGGGAFSAPVTYGVSEPAFDIVASDLDNDGDADLTAALSYPQQVSVLLNNGDGTFQPSTAFNAGGSLIALAGGDLNGDGNQDIATANLNGAGTVSILLGNGNGTFQSPRLFPAGGSPPQSIAAFDSDGDGDLDLVVPNRDRTTVTVLRNHFGSFRRRTSFLTDGGPYGVASGEFNGDGSPDIVTANATTHSVSVILNVGGGAFSAVIPLSSGKNSLDIASGDLNGDGDPDLAVSGYDYATGTPAVTILTGEAGASFKIKSTVNGGYFGKVATQDMDGDGIPDLVALRFEEASLGIFKGLGDATFEQAPLYAYNDTPLAVTSSDLNGDGHLDMVSVDSSDFIQVAFGLGDGTFGPATKYFAGNSNTPGVVAVADFNGDGRPDVVVTNPVKQSGNPDQIHVLLNDGSGGLLPATSYFVGDLPINVVVGHFDGDSTLDLVTFNAYSKNVSVLLGNGDGTFSAPVYSDVGDYPWGGAVADFNSDGQLDVIAVTGNATRVLFGNGDGSFAPPVDIGTSLGTNAVATGDLNGDGEADFVVQANLSVGGAAVFDVLLGNGDGTFQPKVTYELINSGANRVMIQDLTGDGATDVALLHTDSSYAAVQIFPGNGDGTLEASVSYLAGVNLSDFATGDFDEDGRADMIVVNDIGLSPSVAVLRGTSNGFAAGRVLEAYHNSPTFMIADFNHDGRPDLAAGVKKLNYLNGVAVFLNQGSLGFSPLTFYPTISGGQVNDTLMSIISDDFNGDGNLDLVASTDLYSQPNSFNFLFGNGDGTFQITTPQATDPVPYEMFAGDFNGDGKLDLATAVISITYGNGIGIYFGNGDGTFQSPTIYPLGLAPTDMVLADVNADGVTDILTANVDTQSPYGSDFSVSVLLGNGDGTFQSPQRYVAGTVPQTLAADDFDGDGWIDVAVGERTNIGRLNVLRNAADWAPLPIGDEPRGRLDALQLGNFSSQRQSNDVAEPEPSALAFNAQAVLEQTSTSATNSVVPRSVKVLRRTVQTESTIDVELLH